MPNPRVNRALVPSVQPDPFGLATTRNFDQGSYAAFAEVSPGVYRITPINHWTTPNKWAWFCVRSGQFAGKTPHFVVAKANHYNLQAGEWLACWSTSPDTDTWTQFDNVSIGATDIEFYHNTAFPGGVVYIASLPMYPFSRVRRRMGVLAANALVGETTSTTNLIVGNMTGRSANDGTGRITPRLPLYGMKIANAVANTKNKAVLSALQHPSETSGAFALEGALDWLIGGTPTAEFLLDWFEFFVYPCRNPQGIYSGYFRVQPENRAAGADFTTTGQWEEVDILKPAIVADINSSADVCLDYHSELSAGDISGVVVNGDTTGQYPIFAAAMEVLDADFELTEAAAGAEDGTLGKLLRDTYGVDLYTTLEQAGEVARGIADWKAFGANTLKALTTMLAQGNFTNGPGVGSRDFNGSTDRIDWESVSNLTGHALTVSMWAYADTYVTNGYLLCIHDSGDTSFGITINTSSSAPNYGYVGFLVNGTTDMQRASVVNCLTTGSWINLVVTWNGTFTAFTGVHIYKNGTEVSYSNGVNGATETTHTGKWSIGGRYYDDSRMFDGKMAQVGVWDAVLDSTAITNLAAGYSPELVAPSNLKFYFKGNTTSLYNEVSGGAQGTADGTSQLTGVGNGPSIIYPTEGL